MFAKYKKRFKRCLISILAVLTAFVILVISSFTVSALDEPLYYLTIAQPTVSPQNAYVEILYNGGYGDKVEVVMFNVNNNDGIDLDVYEGYIVATPKSLGSTAMNAFWLSTSGSGGFLNSFEGSITEGGYVNIKGVKAYGFTEVTFHFTKTLTTDFNIVYGEDQIAYQQRQQIYSLLYAIFQDSSTSDAITSQTNQLLQQQQQTTQQIIQNQQQQTDKILNGGHDTPQYDDFNDNATADSYEDKESQLNERGEQGVEQYNAWGTSLINLFGNPNNPIYKGVSAMSMVIARVTGVENWVYNLLIIALYFGLFGYVVNSIPTWISRDKYKD